MFVRDLEFLTRDMEQACMFCLRPTVPPSSIGKDFPTLLSNHSVLE